MAEPLRYYHNITANVVNVMEGMKASNTRKVRPHFTAQHHPPKIQGTARQKS